MTLDAVARRVRFPSGVRRRLPFVTALLASMFAALAVVLIPATPASAHRAMVRGEAVCETATGQWRVSWTVENNWYTDATLTDVVLEPNESDATLPSTVPSRQGSTNGQVTAVVSVSPDEEEASLSVKATWPDRYSRTATGKVTFTGTCAPPSPEPSPEPSPSSPEPTPTPSKPPVPAAPELPKTGAPTRSLLVTAIGLVGAGVIALILVPRRRRPAFRRDSPQV